MPVLNSIREFLATPALLIGLVTLLGLLLQKKPLEHIIKGTVTAIVGFVLLSEGSNYLQYGALRDFGVLFNYAFHIQGVVPNVEAISSLGIAKYASQVSLVMLFGMVADIVMARFGPFHYIFLTGHHTLYMACLLTIVLHSGGMGGWELVLTGSLLLGLLMALMPALAAKEMRRVTGDDRIALGHFSTIGYLAAAKTAWLATRKQRRQASLGKGLTSDVKIIPCEEKKIKSAEDIHFPAHLSFMRDPTVGIFIVMTVMFLIITGIASGQNGFGRLDISYQTEGFSNWVIYAMVQAAKFSAAIFIILAGVRLVVAEIVPAFKGIAGKLVPHARPAVDCPVLFSYAPNAVMIGFLMSFLGGLVSMIALMGINVLQGNQIVYIIVPGVVAHFFCGGTAGVFANAEGGIWGCIVGSLVHGVLLTMLSLLVIPVLGSLNMSGTTFSDADFCVVGIVLGNLSSVISGHRMFLFSIICFTGPILWEQMKKPEK